MTSTRVKKVICFMLIFMFMLNIFLTQNIMSFINFKPTKNNQIDSIRSLQSETNSYDYWYNYTTHLLNRTGIFHEDWTEQQEMMIENISWTYLYRAQDRFNDPKYNNYNYWEQWVWDNLNALYYPNLTQDDFLKYGDYNSKVKLDSFIKVYWGLMINNYTLEEADILFNECVPNTPYALPPSMVEEWPPRDDPSSVLLVPPTDYHVKGKIWLIVSPFCNIQGYIVELSYYDEARGLWLGITSIFRDGESHLVKFPVTLEAFEYGGLGDGRFSVEYIKYSSWFIIYYLYEVWSYDFQIVDDDDTAPEYKEERTSESKTLQNSENMFFHFRYEDPFESSGDYARDQGITVDYKYRYYPDGPMYSFSESTTNREIIIDCQIEKSEWELYGGKTLQFWASAYDHDDDRVGDSSYHELNGWKFAGKIYENPDGEIANITQKEIEWTGAEWKWDDIGIHSADQSTEIIEIYAGQSLNLYFYIANPTGEDFYVQNAVLNFIASGQTLLTHNIISGTDLIPSTETGKTYNILDIILSSDIFLGTAASTSLIISGSFDYALESPSAFIRVPFSQIYTLIKPPPPTLEFVGFEGPTEGDHFVYKTDDGELNTIWAVYKVTNLARVPILTSQVIDFEENWYNQDTDPETGEGFANLLDIEGDQYNPVRTTIYPGETEIRVRLDVKSAIFFLDLTNLPPGIQVLSYSLYVKKLIDCFFLAQTNMDLLNLLFKLTSYSNLVRALGPILKAISMALAALKTVLLIYMTASPKDDGREYKFSSIIWWAYQYGSAGPFISYDTYGYSEKEDDLPTSGVLRFQPSDDQWSKYNGGLGFQWAAVAAAWIAIALSFGGPILMAFSFIASTLSFALDAIGKSLWQKANDPSFTDSNYTEVVVPAYTNISLPEPTTALEASINEVVTSSIYLEGDLEALNTSIARRNAAIGAGDNESIIKQNEAIYNYSSRISQEYDDLGEGMVRFETNYNQSMTEENITQIEDHAINVGISEDERGNLTQLGYNETEIQEMEDYIYNISVSQSISILRSAFRASSKSFMENITYFYAYLQNESASYEDLSQESLNNTIILKNATQNFPITTADPATLERLEVLYIQAANKLDEKSWTAAIELSTALKNLALETIEQTLNQTYFFYIEEANRIIKIAEEKMKINLIPTKKEIPIKAGVPENLDLIILSTGAPSGTYTLVSNSSWVQPMIQDVNIVEWKSTTVPLTIHLIESFDIDPGRYPINLTIYFEGTDTKRTIIIIVLVVSTRVENMMNYIFYEIADLREEVDARVSFLFDWMIIGQLDNAKCFINDALTAYLGGITPKSVILDKLAKANIELSDVITIILDWIGFISEENGDFISNYLHTIRDHITLTMGATVGTEEAMKVAQIEMVIERMADQIFAEYDLWVALSIDIKLWVASESLDYALIWMALECGDIAENHIILCIQELQCAKCLINDLKAEGKLPGDEADALILTLDGFIAELELLYTHPFHEGDGGTGDIPTHQETEESSTEGVPDSSGTGGQTESPNTEMPTH